MKGLLILSLLLISCTYYSKKVGVEKDKVIYNPDKTIEGLKGSVKYLWQFSIYADSIDGQIVKMDTRTPYYFKSEFNNDGFMTRLTFFNYADSSVHSIQNTTFDSDGRKVESIIVTPNQDTSVIEKYYYDNSNPKLIVSEYFPGATDEVRVLDSFYCDNTGKLIRRHRIFYLFESENKDISYYEYDKKGLLSLKRIIWSPSLAEEYGLDSNPDSSIYHYKDGINTSHLDYKNGRVTFRKDSYVLKLDSNQNWTEILEISNYIDKGGDRIMIYTSRKINYW